MQNTTIHRHLITICQLSGLLASAGIAAERATAAEPLPSVDQILAKHIQASGGKDNILKVNSRVIKGTIDIPAMGITMPWEQDSKAPNKRLSIMEIPGMEPMLDGFDGVVAWTKSQGLVRVKKDEELARQKRECEFYRDLKFKEIYDQLTVTGKQKLGSQEAYAVEAKPFKGASDFFYFNTQSGLLARWDSVFENESGKNDIKVSYDNYKEVDGIKIPHALGMEITAPNVGEIKISVKYGEVRHNVPVEDAKFKKPAQ